MTPRPVGGEDREKGRLVLGVVGEMPDGPDLGTPAPAGPTDTRDALREHELKTWPPYFEAIADGKKTYELRRDDRDFAVGDTLRLREWSAGSGYTGDTVDCVVTHILRDAPSFGLAPGFVLMSLVLPAALDAQETHGPGKCVPVEDANRVLAEERTRLEGALSAAQETVRQIRAMRVKVQRALDQGVPILQAQQVADHLDRALKGGAE